MPERFSQAESAIAMTDEIGTDGPSDDWIIVVYLLFAGAMLFALGFIYGWYMG